MLFVSIIPGSNTGFIRGYISKNVCQAHEWIFMVKIDNAAPFKISFNSPSDSIVTLATALNDTVHTIDYHECNRGFSSSTGIQGFLLDKGKNLVFRQSSTTQIGFIGNSITCGYGIESVEASDPFTEETENHYYTYAAITMETSMPNILQ